MYLLGITGATDEVCILFHMRTALTVLEIPTCPAARVGGMSMMHGNNTTP